MALYVLAWSVRCCAQTGWVLYTLVKNSCWPTSGKSCTLTLLGKLAVDVFHFKRKPFLLIVDSYSKYPEAVPLKDMIAVSIIQFSRVCHTDCWSCTICMQQDSPVGSRLRSQKCPCSPYFPQSNGMAERTILTVRSVIKSATKSMKHASSSVEYSLAQLLMGHMLGSTSPVTKGVRRWCHPDLWVLVQPSLDVKLH